MKNFLYTLMAAVLLMACSKPPLGQPDLQLYTYLKEQQPFFGFDADHRITPLLDVAGWRITRG